VVTNGIAALAETGGILLWTTADVILSPAFFETVNAHCGFGVAGLSHPHQAFESIDDYNVGNISYPPSLGDGIDLLFFSDDVLTHGGGGEIIERYRFVDWGVFEHFLVGVANACAEKRVNLWPVEQVAKINNDRVAAREDNAFFDESLRRNWAVCEQFIADCSQSVLLKSLRFCSLCFGPIGASRFLQTFAAEIWQFFIGGGTGHRVPAEWPAFVREFIESHDRARSRSGLANLCRFRGSPISTVSASAGAIPILPGCGHTTRERR
jgi:hypothetical protein